MTLSLEALADPARFAAAFNAATVAAPIDTSLSRQVLQQLATGPATWFRLVDAIGARRTDLDSTLTAMLAAGQIVRLDHVGGFRYGLPDVSAVPVSTKPEEGKSA